MGGFALFYPQYCCCCGHHHYSLFILLITKRHPGAGRLCWHRSLYRCPVDSDLHMFAKPHKPPCAFRAIWTISGPLLAIMGGMYFFSMFFLFTWNGDVRFSAFSSALEHAAFFWWYVLVLPLLFGTELVQKQAKQNAEVCQCLSIQ